MTGKLTSHWKKAGLFIVGPDNLFNPSEAARQVMRNAAPARLRVPMLRQAMETTKEAQMRAEASADLLHAARARIAELERERDELRQDIEKVLKEEQQVRASRYLHMDEISRREAKLHDYLERNLAELTEAQDMGRLGRALTLLFGRFLHAFDEATLDELERDRDEEEDDGVAPSADEPARVEAGLPEGAEQP